MNTTVTYMRYLVHRGRHWCALKAVRCSCEYVVPLCKQSLFGYLNSFRMFTAMTFTAMNAVDITAELRVKLNVPSTRVKRPLSDFVNYTDTKHTEGPELEIFRGRNTSPPLPLILYPRPPLSVPYLHYLLTKSERLKV